MLSRFLQKEYYLCRRMGRKSLREIRRQEILECVYSIVKNEGMSALSFRTIGKEMGVNPSLIVHYFESKNELLSSFFHFLFDRYSEILKVNSNTLCQDSLKNIIQRILSNDWEHFVDNGVFFECYALIFKHQNLKETMKKMHLKMEQDILNILKKAKQDGVIRHENLESLTRKIYTIVDGTYYHIGFTSNEEELQKLIQFHQNWALELLGLTETQ